MTSFFHLLFYNNPGDRMKVAIFDAEDEKDLEEDINDFLSSSVEVIDIKYQVSTSIYEEEQIFCFSAMILYLEKT